MHVAAQPAWFELRTQPLPQFVDVVSNAAAWLMRLLSALLLHAPVAASTVPFPPAPELPPEPAVEPPLD
jgi:hypothetical protein